jgi:transposase
MFCQVANVTMRGVMMHPNEELNKLRKEARELRQENATLTRSRDAHHTARQKLEKRVIVQNEKIQECDGRIQELEKENAELKSRLGIEIDKVKTYVGMIFKANIRKRTHKKTELCRGGKKGHKGGGRKNPDHIDQEIDIHLTNCYDCGTALNQTLSVDKRVVEDIPHVTTTVTCYRIQRQWCTTCHKEVRATPQGTIPGCRFGIGTLALILTLKYRLRTPLKKIEELLQEQYHLSITSQGIQEFLHSVKTKFTKQYNEILEEIRRAPVKHADETGYRIDGVNGWCWLFATQTTAFYTIEETRGKGVPLRILGNNPSGVLVRDDCPSYFHLTMAQQSCWAHLLRVSHDAVEHEGASKAVGVLHDELKQMFVEINNIVSKPFRPRVWKRYYDTYLATIDTIIQREYRDEDVRAIQTRIGNQRENLLTALLYEHVPLTNNHAERMIRPMVITRKISGGARSDKGAATHSVNMSIMQTLALQGKNFFEGITEILQKEDPRYALGNSW